MIARQTNKFREQERVPAKRIGVVELFAGAGGLAQGFMQAGLGYVPLALSDIDDNARNTFRHNFGDVPYIREDAVDLTAQRLLDIAGGRTIHGLLGGPPCQGFSPAGRKNPNDERNKLIAEYARFVRELQPKFLLLENVSQILFHPRFQHLFEELAQSYSVTYGILNAARYGIPQTRHRVFVLAYHKSLDVVPTFPVPTHGFVEEDRFNYYACRMEAALFRNGREAEVDEMARTRAERHILGADPVIGRRLHTPTTPDENSLASLKPLVSVQDALGDIASIPPTEVGQGEAAGAITIPNHCVRRHGGGRMRLLMESIPEGGDLRFVKDPDLLPKSHYSQAYGRLHWRGLSRTITTYFCNPGSGRFLHPVQHRALSVREAARLQGFADDYVFLGKQSEQMRLVGNAVPPGLASVIAQHIAIELNGRIEGD